MRFAASLWSSVTVVLMSACTTDFDKYRFGATDDSEGAADPADGGSDADGAMDREDAAADPAADADAPDPDAGTSNEPSVSFADGASEPPDAGGEPDADTVLDEGGTDIGQCEPLQTAPFAPLERAGPAGDPTAEERLPGAAFDDLSYALFHGLMARVGVCEDGILRGFSTRYQECSSRHHGLCEVPHATTGSVELPDKLVGVSGVTGQLADGRTCVLELSLHTGEFNTQVHGPFGSVPAGIAVQSFSFQGPPGGFLVAFHGYISTSASGTPAAGEEDYCISSLGVTFGGDFFGGS